MARSDERYQRLVRRTAEVKARVDEAREQLREARHEGISDDEQIAATVDATGRLVGLRIDPRVFRRPDSEQLAESVVEATQRAAEKADAAIAQLVEGSVGVSVRPDQLRTGELDNASVEAIGNALREDG